MISRITALLIATTEDKNLYIATTEFEGKWNSTLYLKNSNSPMTRLLHTNQIFDSNEEAKTHMDGVCTWCKTDFLTNEINEVHITLVADENEQ